MSNLALKRGLNFKTETPSIETCNSVNYFSNMMNKIHDFFNDKKFCDVILIAKDDLKIDAHKLVLCASSEYFLAMFGGSMREADENQVKLQIDGVSLKSVVNYMYTASIELTTDNVEDILITANMLELDPLKVLCCEFIVKQLDPSNCLGIALFAEQYSLQELYNVSETYLCENFEKLCKDEEFFKLDIFQLSKFLSSSELRVDSEEDVFRSLLSWVDHDRPKREEFMSKLLHHVRFSLLTPKFIATVIEPTCKTIECERLICKAYKWHLLPDFRLSLYTEKQTELRNYNGLVMAISGWSSNKPNLNFGVYYPTLDGWLYKSAIPSLEVGRSEFGSTTLNGKLIIAGGSLVPDGKVTDRVDCLDLKTFQWTSLAPLNMKRMRFGMATVDGCIYAVAGHNGLTNLNTVEKYDPSTREWKFIATMHYSSNTMHVSATLKKLCVSVKDGSGKYHHNLYDPATNTWQNNWLVTADDLLGTGTVRVFSNDFFIAVSRKTITRYNYVIKSSETVHISKGAIDEKYTNCAGFGDRMIAYGNSYFQEYNPFRNELKVMPNFENSSADVILISNR